jgi:hypothetical protein
MWFMKLSPVLALRSKTKYTCDGYGSYRGASSETKTREAKIVVGAQRKLRGKRSMY